MTKNMKQLIFWMPLVVGVLFATFFSIIALHFWGQGHDILETVLGVIMQLLPGIMLAITIAMSWRWKWMGALFFLSYAGWSVLAANGSLWTTKLMLARIPPELGALLH